MTRSFAHMSAGRVEEAARLQPMGALLSFVVGCAAWLSGWGGATGSRIGVAAARVVGMRGVWALLVLIGAGWLYTLTSWGG